MSAAPPDQPREDGAITFADPADAQRFMPGMVFMFASRQTWWMRLLRWLRRVLRLGRRARASTLTVTGIDHHGGVITYQADEPEPKT